MVMEGDAAAEKSQATELEKKMAEESFTPPRAQLTDGAGSSGGELRVVERVVRQSSVVAALPPLMLTTTNYTDWALVMRVQLQGQGRWEVVEHGSGSYHDDREALGAILHAVPPEMLHTLAVKNTTKEAWDTLKTLRLGSERVREARAQTRRSEFDNIQFKDGEKVEQFTMRLTGIMHDLEVLGDGVTEHKAALKFLRVVPKRFRQLAHSISQLLDLKAMTVEELTGASRRLRRSSAWRKTRVSSMVEFAFSRRRSGVLATAAVPARRGATSTSARFDATTAKSMGIMLGTAPSRGRSGRILPSRTSTTSRRCSEVHRGVAK
jgi:hypothetical protein